MIAQACGGKHIGGRLVDQSFLTALRETAGIAFHDVYHTGQIQLLKALLRKRRGKS